MNPHDDDDDLPHGMVPLSVAIREAVENTWRRYCERKRRLGEPIPQEVVEAKERYDASGGKPP